MTTFVRTLKSFFLLPGEALLIVGCEQVLNQAVHLRILRIGHQGAEVPRLQGDPVLLHPGLRRVKVRRGAPFLLGQPFVMTVFNKEGLFLFGDLPSTLANIDGSIVLTTGK